MMFRSVLFIFLSLCISSSYASNFYMGVNVGYAAHSADINVINNVLDPDLGFDFEKDYQSPDTDALSYSLFLGYKLSSDLSLELGYTDIQEFEGDQRTFTDICIPPGTGSSPCAVPVDDPNTNLVAEETVKTNNMSVSFVGQWPIHERWAFHAKLGMAAWKYKYTQELIDVNDSVLQSQTAGGTCFKPSDPSNTFSCPAPIPNPVGVPVNLGPEYDELVTLDEFRTESYSDSGIDLIYGMGIGYGIDKSFEIRFDVEAHSFNPKFRNINVDADLYIFTVGLVTHF